MSEKLQSVLSGFLPKVVSAYQNTPWAFWLIGAALALGLIYLVTLPRRRREYVRKNFHFFTRRANEGDWRFASIPFPGQISFRRFGTSVTNFAFKGEERNLINIQTLPSSESPTDIGAWHRDWSDQEGMDWLAVRIQQPQRRLPRWPFVLAALVVIGLLCGFVARPAYQNWRTERNTAEVVEAPIPPTMPAPLSCDINGNCVEQGSDVAPTPEPEVDPNDMVKLEDSVLVIDLDDPYERTPSAIENRLNEWISTLPTGHGPNIHLPTWIVDLFTVGDHTIIALGDDGFVIVSSWTHGLEYRRTDESLNQIGDKIAVYGKCGTVAAGKDEGELHWGVCFKGDEWKLSKYSKGNYNIQVYDGGLVVDTKGFYPRWTPLWLLAILPLIGLGLLIWRRLR